MKFVQVWALVALVALMGGCSGGGESTVIAPPSPFEVGTKDLSLGDWMELSSWPASEGAWRRVYTCKQVNLPTLLEKTTSRKQSVCAYRLSERVCMADWEGTGTLWADCCSGDEATSGFCSEFAEEFPNISSVVELFELYKAHPDSLADGYYYHGTARRIEEGKLPAEVEKRVLALHREFALLEVELMVAKHEELDANVPICVGQGNNWGYFCFHRGRSKLGALVHYDTHADFAFRRSGYPHLAEALPAKTDDNYWALQTEAFIDIDEFIQPGLVDGSLHPRTMWVVPTWTREFYEEREYHVSLHLAEEGKIISYSADMDYDGVTYGLGDEDTYAKTCEDKLCRDPVQVLMSVVDNAREGQVPADTRLVLSIDLDYFGSTNPSPEDGELPVHCPSDAEREKIFQSVVADWKGFERPEIVPIALSPDFSCRLWESQLLGRILAMLEQRWGEISAPGAK